MVKRRVFFVDKKFQYEFLIRNIGLLLFSVALMFILMKAWEKNRLKQGVLLSPPSSQQVMEWAEKNKVSPDSKEFISQFIVQAKMYTLFDLIWQPLIIVLLLNAIVMYITNIYFSHRVMGPIHRLKTTLMQKIEGKEIKPIRFRKKDYFLDLAELVNIVLFPEMEAKELSSKEDNQEMK